MGKSYIKKSRGRIFFLLLSTLSNVIIWRIAVEKRATLSQYCAQGLPTGFLGVISSSVNCLMAELLQLVQI